MAVHSIQCGLDSKGCVAVGDTFVFSPGMPRLKSLLPSTGSRDKDNLFVEGLFTDKFCLTHCIPYYRCFVGGGREEAVASRRLAASRNPHMYVEYGLLTTSDCFFVCA